MDTTAQRIPDDRSQPQQTLRSRDDPGTQERELYREVQPLARNPYLLITLGTETLIMGVIFVSLMVSASSRPSNWVIAFIAGAILTPPLVLLVRMVTIVTDRHLIIRYRPFPGRRIPVGAITQADAIEYNPLASGGWGWRISRAYHRVFNVWGNKGVHVRFGEGKRHQFLAGSKDADALAEAIDLARVAHGSRPIPEPARNNPDRA